MADVYGDWYGLDFGTSNTAVSILKNREAFVLPIDQVNSNKEIFQSAICFFQGKQYFGSEAIEKYLEEIVDTNDKTKNSDVRLIRSFKSLLGRQTDVKTNIDGKIITIEDIVTAYFSEIKRRADEMVGKNVKKIVVGRPVKFVGQKNDEGTRAQETIKRCLLKVGFETVEFEYEPVAAARRYADVKKGKVLVFDFGGGTLDVAVVNLDTNSLLAFEGEPIGGDLIDYLLFDTYLAKYFGKGLKYRNGELNYPIWAVEKVFDWSEIIGLRNNDFYAFLSSLKNRSTSEETVGFIEYFVKHNLTYSFRRAVIRSKMELSNIDEAVVGFTIPGYEINEKIARNDLEKKMGEFGETVNSILKKVLRKSGLSNADIDKVVMTGGSSFIPYFQNLLAEKFFQEKIVIFEPFTSVAKGLVLTGRTEGGFLRESSV